MSDSMIPVGAHNDYFDLTGPLTAEDRAYYRRERELREQSESVSCAGCSAAPIDQLVKGYDLCTDCLQAYLIEQIREPQTEYWLTTYVTDLVKMWVAE